MLRLNFRGSYRARVQGLMPSTPRGLLTCARRPAILQNQWDEEDRGQDVAPMSNDGLGKRGR